MTKKKKRRQQGGKSASVLETLDKDPGEVLALDPAPPPSQPEGTQREPHSAGPPCPICKAPMKFGSSEYNEDRTHRTIYYYCRAKRRHRSHPHHAHATVCCRGRKKVVETVA